MLAAGKSVGEVIQHLDLQTECKTTDDGWAFVHLGISITLFYPTGFEKNQQGNQSY